MKNIRDFGLILKSDYSDFLDHMYKTSKKKLNPRWQSENRKYSACIKDIVAYFKRLYSLHNMLPISSTQTELLRNRIKTRVYEVNVVEIEE